METLISGTIVGLLANNLRITVAGMQVNHLFN